GGEKERKRNGRTRWAKTVWSRTKRGYVVKRPVKKCRVAIEMSAFSCGIERPFFSPRAKRSHDYRFDAPCICRSAGRGSKDDLEPRQERVLGVDPHRRSA